MVMVGYNPMQVTVGGLPFQVYFDYCVISSRTVSNQTNAEVILDGQMAGRGYVVCACLPVGGGRGRGEF